MLRAIIHFHESALKALEQGVEMESILGLAVREKMSKIKFLSEEDTAALDVYIEIDGAFRELLKSEQ